MSTLEDQSGIPHLSANDIEVKAEEVIEFFDKSVLDKPQPTPLMAFLEVMRNRFNVQFDCMKDLGITKTGKKILGIFKFKPRTILIDHSLNNSDRFSFTVGHEFGHLVLHRNLNITKEDYSEIQDTEVDLVTGKKILTTPRDWIEWQANYFSSSILMPRANFRRALIETQQKLEIAKNLGSVFVEARPYSLRDLIHTLEQLAIVYGVNKTNVQYRLSSLGLLHDQREKDITHISELLQHE